MQIGQRIIDSGQPVYVIAEIGINHNGSLLLAKELVHAAKEAGADAVKLQKRKVDAVFTRSVLAQPYDNWLEGGPAYGEYKRALELSWVSYHELVDYSRKLGIDLGITFFDLRSAEEFAIEFSIDAIIGGGSFC